MMVAAQKFELVKKRIELMLEEIKILGIDAEEIVKETQNFHQEAFSNFDILDRDQRLAERSASDKIFDACALRGSISHLRANFESELRNLQYRTAFEQAG